MESVIATGNPVVTPPPLSSPEAQLPSSARSSPAKCSESTAIDISTAALTPTPPRRRESFPDDETTTAQPLSARSAATTTVSTPTQTLHYGLPSLYNFDEYDNPLKSYKLDAATIQDDVNVSIELIPCSICNRTFNPSALSKHIGICQKMATKKRKIFDSQRQRREGTELASYPLPKDYGLPAVAPTVSVGSSATTKVTSPKAQQVASPILTRRKSNEDFVRNTARTSMRKQAATPSTSQNSLATSVAASTTSSNFTRDRMRSSERGLGKRAGVPASEQCPHCDRCFGVKAYDRHVEWCKEKAVQAAIKQTNKSEQNVAKERLEARIKYRAPCLKTKRSLNREKYSGAGEENDGDLHRMPGNSYATPNAAMSLSMTSSMTSDRPPPPNTDDQMASVREAGEPSEHCQREHLEFLVTGTEMETCTSKKLVSPRGKTRKAKKLRQLAEGPQDTDSDGNDMQRTQPSISSTTLVLSKATSKVAGESRHGGKLFQQVAYEESASVLSLPVNIAATAAGAAAKRTKVQATRVGELASSKQASSQPSQESEEEVRSSGPPSGRRRSVGKTQKPNQPVEPEKLPEQPKVVQPNEVAKRSGGKLQKSVEKAQANPRRTGGEVDPSREYPSCSNSKQQTGHGPTKVAESQGIASKREIEAKARKALIKQRSFDHQLAIETVAPLQVLEDDTCGESYDLEEPLKKDSLPLVAARPLSSNDMGTAEVQIQREAISMKALQISNRKRTKLTRASSCQPSATTSQSVPLKAMPLLKETVVTVAERELIYANSETPLAQATLQRDRSFIVRGVAENYDPFLSAKRQLEELCSPTSTTTPTTTLETPQTPQTPYTPTTPIMGHKMTSSLTLSTSQPNSSPLTNNTLPRTPLGSSTPKPSLVTSSNFRRTSSLRGPRRSPMLSSRPLFAQKPRPTIQRGLSDEGPISTNFLKPEEYDEMPVRSVCVNDFAITNSPRVVRRDTSNSNRKNSVKVNVPQARGHSPGAALAAHSSDERLATASKYLSKTDSLAVFLKYENELEKLHGSPGTHGEVNAKTNPIRHSPPVTPAAEAPVITKEFKDKSNTLSKQNSAKNIKNQEEETSKSPATCLPVTPVSQAASTNGDTSPTSSVKENNEMLAGSQPRYGTPLKLEPIVHSKPLTPLAPLSKPNTPYSAKTSAAPLQLPAFSQAINLNAILGDSKGKPLPLARDWKLTASKEYIDPKLINKCDNLPVNVAAGRTLKHSDSDCSEKRSDSSSQSSHSSASAAGPMTQITKLKPLTAVKSEAPQVAHKEDSSMPAATTTTPSPLTAQHRNSAEGRNLLKRKIRLGRNQFLYDAPSPEADSCSADDEANRSSAEYDEKQFSPIRASLQQQRQQEQLAAGLTSPLMPQLDDFDFEEFLSSFENDDEQFPLFKDCREFLMNRSSNKKRSTLTPNSNTNPSDTTSQQRSDSATKLSNLKNHQSSTNTSTSTITTTPNTGNMTTPPPAVAAFPSQSLFQFPQLPKSPMFFPHPSSFRPGADGEPLGESAAEHKKREIFISIETEQNDLGRSPISPDSLRSMLGNAQAVVEVEVNGNDNKFSKISDDEPITATTPHHSKLLGRSGYESGVHLPNVQLNNAKNLIQKMQDDFHQLSEGASATARQAPSYFLSDAVGGGKRPSTTGGIPIPSKERIGRGGGDAGHDSDDLSSVESYPMSTQSSRRGAGSKMSADSAYGSLSRQRSTEMPIPPPRSVIRTPRPRPGTANCATNTTMQQLPRVDAPKYSSARSGTRHREVVSSSGSENSLTTNVSSVNVGSRNCNRNLENEYHQDRQQQQQLDQQHAYLSNMHNNNNNPLYDQRNQNNNNNNQVDHHSFNICDSLHSPNNNSSNTNRSSAAPSRSTSSSSVSMATNSVASSQMTASMKMSKFCHECGSKFVIEHAKFCMDCGVKRIVL